MCRRVRASVLRMAQTFRKAPELDVHLALAHLEGTRDPLPGSPCPFYVLIETASVDLEPAARGRLEAFLEACAEAGDLAILSS